MLISKGPPVCQGRMGWAFIFDTCIAQTNSERKGASKTKLLELIDCLGKHTLTCRKINQVQHYCMEVKFMLIQLTIINSVHT